MEELKETAGDPSSGSDAPAESGRRFALPKLSKRALIIAGLVVLVLFIAATAGMLYRSAAQKKQAAVELTRQKAEQMAKAHEESAVKAAELKRAHQEIMAGSVAAPVPPHAANGAAAASATDFAAAVVSGTAVASVLAPAAAPATLSAELAKPASVVPATPPTGPPAATRAAATAAAPRKAESAAVKAPDAAGGCAVSGQDAADYGKALAKCLEEFNRLEGRSPSVRQEAQK
jgi:hypothetical protein